MGDQDDNHSQLTSANAKTGCRSVSFTVRGPSHRGGEMLVFLKMFCFYFFFFLHLFSMNKSYIEPQLQVAHNDIYMVEVTSGKNTQTCSPVWGTIR